MPSDIEQGTGVSGNYWPEDLLRCLDHLPREFMIADLYEFAPLFAAAYSKNRHIKSSLPHQLHQLRLRGFVQSMETFGAYRRLQIGKRIRRNRKPKRSTK